jgi:hypothetical protein
VHLARFACAAAPTSSSTTRVGTWSRLLTGRGIWLFLGMRGRPVAADQRLGGKALAGRMVREVKCRLAEVVAMLGRSGIVATAPKGSVAVAVSVYGCEKLRFH